MDPSESLWLAILQRDDDLAKLSDAQAREVLERGDFPESLIAEFLAERHPEKRAAGIK